VVRGSTQVFFPDMRRVQENTVINTKNKSHAVTADIEVPASGAAGVIVAQGGAQGGWAIYVHQGRLRYHYNLLGAKRASVTSDSPLPAGAHQVRMEFAYDGGGLGKGAAVTLFCDGKAIGKGRVERTHLFAFALDETLEVGCDLGEPVSDDYGQKGNEFTGTIKWVQIDIDAAAKDVDHMIGAEERFRFAMTRQ
jgi:arylsulfatase